MDVLFFHNRSDLVHRDLGGNNYLFFRMASRVWQLLWAGAKRLDSPWLSKNRSGDLHFFDPGLGMHFHVRKVIFPQQDAGVS